jgi:hypothetical protein
VLIRSFLQGGRKEMKKKKEMKMSKLKKGEWGQLA